jgi:cation diffusion facilitator CzcD-associated flavoprotein CzcO
VTAPLAPDGGHPRAPEHFDVLVVGAGISGVAAGYYLSTRCPRKRYAILEGRSELGGTWSLFRYPGVRSDSDMFTLGYSFHPWKEARAIADGPSILAYLRDTAQRFGVDRHVRFGQRVRAASWSSSAARWTVEAQGGEAGERAEYTCSFLYLCSGYYRYEHGYTPSYPGRDAFAGRVVHPQEWPADLDYRGQRVVVIGSGATAVTLVPAMAKDAAHVTMLQRSPSYVLSRPSRDPIGDALRSALPERAAHHVIRWKNAGMGLLFYQYCRRFPASARKILLRGVARELPPGATIEEDWSPRYDPWDQRLCLVPDADLFEAIRAGRASVKTGRIKTLCERGILLESGEEIPADLIVTATGLDLLAGGGVQVSVDGRAVAPGQALVYKGLMLGDVPNLAMCVGYTNASWTLRAELASAYVCKLLDHMDRRGYRRCVPRLDGAAGEPRPLLDLSAGYVQRRADQIPKQGSRSPWILPQNYLLDLIGMKLGAVEDGTMVFSA